MRIDGGCYCGRVTYEAEIDPEKVLICHCTDCQMLSGSAFRTVALTRENTFDLRSGELKIYIKTGDSGVKRQQAFCPECGTPIYSATAGEGPKVHAIRLGTIRQRGELVPKTQWWVRSAPARSVQSHKCKHNPLSTGRAACLRITDPRQTKL